MKYTIEFKESYAEVWLSGKMHPTVLENCLLELINGPSWMPGMRVLIDYLEVDFHKYKSFSGAEQYASILLKHKEKIGPIKVASVFNDRELFAISNLSTLTREFYGYKIESNKFTDKTTALKWLL